MAAGPILPKIDAVTVQELEDIANRIRINSIIATDAAKSGHPTSCSSIAEILSVLFFHTMKYKVHQPKDISNDRLVLSKGHAAPALYAAWCEAGLIPAEDLKKLRQLDSNLEGHPTPRLEFIDVATGSLGQGLSIACGMAYVGKNYDKASYRCYCIIGDGESAEGSIWEALSFASYYHLDNLIAIFDINRLGQSEETALGHNLDAYSRRLEAFGFKTFKINGHNIQEIIDAFNAAETVKGQPIAIIAKTFKGKHFLDIEDTDNWHGKPVTPKSAEILKHLKSLLHSEKSKLQPRQPKDDCKPNNLSNIKLSAPPLYKIGDKIATRQAYGKALVKLATTNSNVIALDGDMKNSTFSEELKKTFPSKFIECFIAEQNLVGVAIGATCRDRTVAFVSTFACFLTRAFDNIRMGAISQTNVNFVGSHCGVSIGEDGPSQMALEDIAMFRSIPGCTIFYPSDAVSTEYATELAANTKGITFIRTSRPTTAVIYENTEKFEIGQAKIIKKTQNDKVLAIGGGVTLYEILSASQQLQGVRVMDLFTIKPIDKNGIIKNARECGGIILVVEDHYPEGGMGEAVMAAVASEKDVTVKHIAVREIPRSGKPAELLRHCGIDSTHIVQYIQELLA